MAGSGIDVDAAVFVSFRSTSPIDWIDRIPMVSAIVVNGAAVSKPWMAMVHGMSQDHRVFSAQVEAFKPHFRILLIDLPGLMLWQHSEGRAFFRRRRSAPHQDMEN